MAEVAQKLGIPNMSNDLLVLAGSVALAYGIYVFTKKQDPFSPPQVPSYVPFLGSAIDFGRDSAKFLRRQTQKYGPVFRVNLAGQNMIYVTSPQIIQNVYREPKTFQFAVLRKEMASSIFGANPKVAVDYENSGIFAIHHREFAPNAIGGVLSSYVHTSVQELSKLLHTLKTSNATEVPLWGTFSPIMYVSGSFALFGPRFPIASTTEPFLTFDEAFPLIAGGLPKFMWRDAARAREELVQEIETWVKDCEKREQEGLDGWEGACDYIKALPPIAKEWGWTSRDIADMIVQSHWALQGNSTHAAVWLLALIIEHNLQERVLAEFTSALSSYTPSANAGSDLPHVIAPLEDTRFLSSLQLLDGCIQETLRLYTDSTSIRRVVGDDAILRGEGDRMWKLKNNETIICAGRINHLDEGVWDEAESWKPERWLSGEKAKGRIMMPFGGGVSMCEGRHFAAAELKSLILVCLLCFDFELLYCTDAKSRPIPNTEGKVPIAANTRAGLGALQPQGDVMVKMTPKEDAAKILALGK